MNYNINLIERFIHFTDLIAKLLLLFVTRATIDSFWIFSLSYNTACFATHLQWLSGVFFFLWYKRCSEHLPAFVFFDIIFDWTCSIHQINLKTSLMPMFQTKFDFCLFFSKFLSVNKVPFVKWFRQNSNQKNDFGWRMGLKRNWLKTPHQW